MKRILALMLATFLLASCKKETNCWTCHIMGTYNGVTYDEYEEYCTENPPTSITRNGYDVGFQCSK